MLFFRSTKRFLFSPVMLRAACATPSEPCFFAILMALTARRDCSTRKILRPHTQTPQPNSTKMMTNNNNTTMAAQYSFGVKMMISVLQICAFPQTHCVQLHMSTHEFAKPCEVCRTAKRQKKIHVRPSPTALRWSIQNLPSTATDVGKPPCHLNSRYTTSCCYRDSHSDIPLWHLV